MGGQAPVKIRQMEVCAREEITRYRVGILMFRSIRTSHGPDIENKAMPSTHGRFCLSPY